ncbi:MAG TPA: hypothetical protein VHU13_01270 [Solirubrobacteraceae bacterium]|nr:hypothetical protein [Solirubrobacteraceae bacterium]
MGMLDEAIREHLELKRLRGADPGEVAREEHDALGRVPRREDAPDGESNESAEATASKSGESVDDADNRPVASATGQETVEIDMEPELRAETVSVGDAASGERDIAPRATPVGHPAHTQANPGESPEWEMPADRSTEDGELADDEAVEDVLEETPDFLRETPEHERLWFEQQPPRDFDFNE